MRISTNIKGIIAIVLLLALGWPLMIHAQKFSAAVSKNKVAIGEPIQLSFSANGNISGFKPPAFSDFDIYSGPNNYTSYQITNGQQSVSNTLSYVLVAKREGKFTIGSASAVINGQRMESNPVNIEVVKGSAGQQQNTQAPASHSSGAGDNLFTKTIVSRSKVYLGEQISLSHKIYTRLSLRGFQDFKFPSYNGFWSQEPPTQSQIVPTNENIDGIMYQVAEMKKTFLFPQRTGTIEIGPAEFECVVRQRNNRAPRDMFEQLFGTGGYEDVVMKTTSRPVKIEVIPLPEQGKPDNFSGAVGNFTFKASIDKDKLKANEAVNLKITVSGSGNLKLIEAIKINFPEGIETYDPKVIDNITISASGVNGSKTFEYLLIPRRAGNYKIEPGAFSYFNPAKKTYVTIPASKFNLQVDKGDENTPGTNSSVMITQEDVKMLGNDIRYIKTNFNSLTKQEEYFFGSPEFVAGLSAPALAFLLFLVLRKRHQEQNSDLQLVKRKKAGKMAQKRLSAASVYLKENNKEAFYSEVLQALQGYFSDKLNIPVSGLSRESILDALREKKVEENTLQQAGKLIDNCEFARYAPSAVQSGLESTYNEAIAIISTIETGIK